jgi:DNA-binding transcriptional regulator GbsR (MarR family)
MLRESLLDPPGAAADKHAQERMRAMHDLIELTSEWFDDVRRLDSKTLVQLMRMGSRVQRLLEAKNKLALVGRRPPS